MMKTRSTSKRPKSQAEISRGQPRGKPRSDEMNQATVDEFEREGMGVAAKE